MCYWDDEEARARLAWILSDWKHDRGESLPVRVVCDTSQGVVPCHECREQREKAAGLDDRWVWRTGRVPV